MNRYLSSVRNINNWFSFWKYYYKIKNKGSDKCDIFYPEMKDDISLELPPGMMATFDEVFLRQVYKLGDYSSKSPVIIDAGANVGYFSLYAFSKFPNSRIIAFEPISKNLTLLHKHAALNPKYDLTIDENAVFGHQTTLTMSYVDNDLYTTGASVFERKNTDALLEVQAISLADIFKKYQLDTVDLVKLDCEGAEFDILYNCPDEIFAKIKYLTIEVHNWVKSHNINDLQKFLQSKGYNTINSKNEILHCHRLG
ncbi:MAG: FkbM family methyltransferase [Cyclobacteriaceae bacterium]|nr:FkbM family methyltransferase [Cyclobacteriaceae bacterium]